MTVTSPHPTRDLPKLPRLQATSMPKGFDTLDSIKKLAAESDALNTKAKEASATHRQKLNQIPIARIHDTDALAAAARDGKPDPGRANEAKALTELDTAHRLAEGAITAANRAAYAVKEAISTEPGDQALADLDKRSDKAKAEVAKAAKQLLAGVTELSEINRLQGIIDETRKGKSHQIIPTGRASLTVLTPDGSPLEPERAIHVLLNSLGIEGDS